MGTRFKTILTLTLCTLALPAYAQQDAQNSGRADIKPYQAIQPNNTPDNNVGYVGPAFYKSMSREAIERRPEHFDFTTFRTYYALTEMYDPLGERTRNKLLNIAYVARYDTDNTKRKNAMADYADLLAAHLANVDVLLQARALSEQDKAFGDPKFFDWMISGIVNSVKESGDGQSLAGAYDIITLGEETLLLVALNATALKSQSQEEGGVYYTMDQVVDPKSYGPYWMFINTSVPMAFLDQQKKQLGTVISIPKQ